MDALPTAGMIALFATIPIENVGGTCPEPQAIRRHLDTLLPAAPLPSELNARVGADEDHWRVELLDGSVRVASRELAADDASCEDRAKAAAVILAAWIAQLRSESLELAPPPPAAPTAPTSPALEWTALAGISGTRSGSENSLGFGAGLLLLHRSGLGAEFGFAWAAPVRQAVGRGEAEWNRPTVTLSATYRLSTRWVWLDLHGGGAAALLRVRGIGYDRNADASDIDPGVTGGVRLSPSWSALSPWMDVAATGWLRGQHVWIGGTDVSSTLPTWELRWTLGVRVSPSLL